ncbi:hypothetical protein ACVWYF_002380 [Hymenobacter sp. UYAg731]
MNLNIIYYLAITSAIRGYPHAIFYLIFIAAYEMRINYWNYGPGRGLPR